MQSCLVCIGLVSAILLTAQAVPYPGPNAYPAPLPFPSAVSGPAPGPAPSCCNVGQACGLGLCGCCSGSSCQNGACAPIIPYAEGFYGPPRVLGGYGNTFAYGR